MNRRNFIRATSCGTLLTDTLPPVSHAAAESHPPVPGSLGMLYDSTSCVGCQACVTRCQDINFSERNLQGEQTWLNNDKLLLYTNDIIQVRTSSTGVNKDQEENGYAYIRRQCMYYVDPNCVSVCLVSTLKKDPKADIVHYDKDVRISCHYYMAACPYNMPRYDYNNPFGALHKCELYNQKGVERFGKGGPPSCVEVRPAGMVIFDTHEESMAEAKKCLVLKSDSEHHYLCQALKSGDTYLHTVSKYYPCLYDEKEDGSTQVLVLTGVPYENPSLPKLGDLSISVRSEHV